MTGHWFATLNVSRRALWAALTEEEHLGAWLDPGAALDLRACGNLKLPGQTQFRGMLGAVTLVEYEPEALLLFSWPVQGIPTILSFKVSGNDSSSRIDVVQTLEGEDHGRISPPRSDWGTLRHYWKQNLAALKFYLELGRAPNRAPLAARGLPEVNLSFTYDHPQEKIWRALTDPTLMDQWIAKKAEVDLRVGGKITYAWDHGATKIVELVPGNVIAYTWVNGNDESIVRWELTAEGENQTRLDFRHHRFSGEAPQRPTGYNEGWFTFLLILGLYLETGEQTKEWSNLNDDPNS